MLEVCTPEIQEYLDGFVDSARSSHVQHKEAMQSFVRQFLSHCRKVLSIFQTNSYSYKSFTFPVVNGDSKRCF